MNIVYLALAEIVKLDIALIQIFLYQCSVIYSFSRRLLSSVVLLWFLFSVSVVL